MVKEPKKTTAKLSKRQEVFVAEYLTDQDATRAYIAAGYSEKGACRSARVLLRNPKIAAKFRALRAKRNEHLDLTGERVLAGIASIAFSYDGSKSLAERLHALELLGEHLRLFGEEGGPLTAAFLDRVLAGEYLASILDSETDTIH